VRVRNQLQYQTAIDFSQCSIYKLQCAKRARLNKRPLQHELSVVYTDTMVVIRIPGLHTQQAGLGWCRIVQLAAKSRVKV